MNSVNAGSIQSGASFGKDIPKRFMNDKKGLYKRSSSGGSGTGSGSDLNMNEQLLNDTKSKMFSNTNPQDSQ